MMNRLHVVLAGVAVLLLLSVVLPAAALLAGRWLGPSTLVISHLAANASVNGSSLLRIEGEGFGRQLNTLLIPAPLPGRDNRQSLLPHTPLHKIQSDGELGVASAHGRRLVTLDVRAGQPPRILGSLKLKDTLANQGVKITALTQVGKRAVIALSAKEGVLLVDLSNPAAPRNVAYLRLPGVVNELLAVNGRIFATAIKSGLWQLHIDDNQFRAEKIPGPEDVWRMTSEGNRIAVITLHGELVLYELDVAGRPRPVGREQLPQTARGVTLGDDALHLCLADGSLLEYAVADWPKLVPRGRLLLPGRPVRLVRSENPRLLFCSLVGVGVCVIDVSRAGAPAVAGWLPAIAPVADLSIVPGRLLTTDNDGLHIYDIADLHYQRLAVEFPIDQRREKAVLLNWRGTGFIYDSSRVVALDKPANGHRHSVEPQGKQELLAVPGDNAVKLYAPWDISDGAPALRATLPIKGEGTAALLHDGRYYVLSTSSLAVFSGEQEGGFKLEGALDAFDDANLLALAGQDFLLVGDKRRGIVVVNVRNAAAPRVVAEQRLPSFISKGSGGVQDILVSGQRAFVARGEFGVQVFDLLSLPELKVVEQIDTPGIARKLAIVDDLLLITDRGRGIQVVELRGDHPRMIATIPFPANIVSFIATKGEILMSNGAAGVMRLPLPRRLDEVTFEDDGQGTVRLPDNLPTGNYRMVLYDGTRMASADFSVN